MVRVREILSWEQRLIGHVEVLVDTELWLIPYKADQLILWMR